jgi:hypothetical protein
MNAPTIAERTKVITESQVAALVQHFDTLYERARATDGPDSYGELLDMQRYPAWDSDVEAKHIAGWLLGFSYATGVSVIDLAVLAAERTRLNPSFADVESQES